MMTQRLSALIVGASGLVGGHLLRELLNDDDYTSVTALIRKPLRIQHPKLIQHTVDFDRLHQSLKLTNVDDVFCTLGTTIKKAGSQEAFRNVDCEYPFGVARVALAAGARQFLIVTALGANATSKIFYNRVKGEVEEKLKTLPFTSIHLFRPSILLGERSERRPAERVGIAVMSAIAPLMIGPFRKYRPIHAATVARAMIAASRQLAHGVVVHESEEIASLGAA